MRRDQVSPGHAALCPTMPPAPTTDPSPVISGYPFLQYSQSRVSREFAPTGSPGFGSLGCGLVICLRSFRFHLTMDTLPSAMAHTQTGQQDFHLQESDTAGRTSTRMSLGNQTLNVFSK